MRQLEPTAILNSGSVPVEMEGCEDVWFKQRAEFLLAGKIFLSLTFVAVWG